MSHVNQEASGHALQPVEGITVHDSEVLEPEPVREGGLMRKDTVRTDYNRHFCLILIFGFVEAPLPTTC